MGQGGGARLQRALLPAARRERGVRALARPHAVAAHGVVPQHLRLAQARARPQHRHGPLPRAAHPSLHWRCSGGREPGKKHQAASPPACQSGRAPGSPRDCS